MENHSSQQPSIQVEIRHPDLYLDGDFTSWQSAVVMGPDMDELTIRLMVDATATWHPWAGRSPRLFSFRGTSVEQIDGGSYRVTGELRAGGHVREMDVIVDTPPFHAPQFGLRFVADKVDLGAGWTELLAAAGISAAPEPGEQPETTAAMPLV